MRRIGLLLGIALASTAVHGEEAPPHDQWSYDAAASAGYRFVDVNGSEARYRSDVDLREGGRLFLFQVDGRSPEADRTPLDRFHLEIDTPGDEPASYFQLTAADRERWDLRADFSRTRWVYEVPQLWQSPVAGDNSLADPHQWNVIRTQGHADLTLRLPNLPTLRFGYRLYERDGETSQSTVFVPAGDTFLLNAPVHSVANVGLLGTDFHWLATDWSLTQEYRVINRRFDATGPVVPGGPGLDPTNDVVLDGYERGRSDHLTMPVTIVRLRRSIGDEAELTGAYLYSHAELDGGEGDVRQAVTSGTPPARNVSNRFGDASGTLDTHVADLGGSVRVARGVTLNASYRFNERSENTEVVSRGTGGPYAVGSGYQVRWQSLTGDVQVEPGYGLTLRAGMRYAHRDANLSLADEAVGTDYIGAIADVRWRPLREVELSARYENVRIDDPLVSPGDPLASPPIPAREIALTSTNRGSAGLRLTPRPWLSLQWELIAESRQNDSFAGEAQSIGNSLGISLTPLEGLSFFAGYTRRDVTTQGNILTAPLYDARLALQDGSEDAVTSQLRWEFPLLGQRWATGWDFSWVLVDEHLVPSYEPGGDVSTPYHVDRVDGGAFLSFLHPWIEPSVEVRRIEYGEQVFGRNDFDATIVALKLTRRFNR